MPTPSEAWFRNAPDALLVVVQGRVTAANLLATELFGVRHDEFVGRHLRELVHGDAAAVLDAVEAKGAGPPRTIRVRLGIFRAGEARLVDVGVTADVEPGVHLLSARDVTEQTRREEMWDRYRLLSESAHDIVLFIRKDGRILEANEAAARAYQRTRGELVGLDIRELRAPDTRGAVATQMREAFARGSIFETVHLRRDGSTFPVEVSSRSARIGDEEVLLSIIRDLSERTTMQARLLHADRMAAVGTLAAGVAHEINNPLAYALTNLEVLARILGRMRDRCAAQPPPVLADIELADQVLAIAREGNERVRAIVRDLKTFSRADDATRGAVDVRAVLDSCINMAAAELRHRARIVRDYRDIPHVEASESRLAQVFLNLLVNAAHALDPARAEGNLVRVAVSTDDEARVVVAVEDNGTGIPESLRDRVFEPFFTTKPVGEGTGLGLFISREIVTTLGGTIEVESEEGRGTRMRVRLPPGPPRSTSIPASPRSERDDRERRLLVIDDEDSIGISVRRALDGELRVVVATSGREAVALLEHDRAFDFVLCDLVMPDLDGASVYAAVKELDRALADRFLFMTGGALDADSRGFLAAMRGRVLEKPFSIDDLRAVLRRRSR